MQLSRKHAIEVRDGVISIFGGKLTDCLNVGGEVFREVVRLGVTARYPESRWYGEPGPAVRDEFFHQARLMELDAMTAASSTEPLSTRLWRRSKIALVVSREALVSAEGLKEACAIFFGGEAEAKLAEYFAGRS